jgi:hypothetical protein
MEDDHLEDGGVHEVGRVCEEHGLGEEPDVDGTAGRR